MEVKILTLKGTIFHGTVYSLTAKTTSGEITVLAHHRPLITLLQPGLVTLKDQTQQIQTFDLGGGFLEVSAAGQVTILAD